MLVLNIFFELHDGSGKQDEHECVLRSVATHPTPILSLLAWCSRRGCMWVVRWACTRVEVEVEGVCYRGASTCRVAEVTVDTCEASRLHMEIR